MNSNHISSGSVVGNELVSPEFAREVLSKFEISLSIEDPRSPERFVTELLVIINAIETTVK